MIRTISTMRTLWVAYSGCHQMAASTAAQYENAVRHWETIMLDCPVDRITAAEVGHFVTVLGASPATANKIRRHLLALLRFGAAIGNVPDIPFWQRQREPRRAPVAFLAEEFQSVLAAAKVWPGWICGVPAGVWWESLLLSLWYSGSRIGAIMKVTWDDVLLDRGGFYVRAEHQKQKADQFFVVGQDCVEALKRAAQPARAIVWPWEHRREALYRSFRRILKIAGVEAGTHTGCLFHRIRKSTASYIRAAGGDATGQLGHSCLSVTQRYFDPRIVGTHDSVSMLPTLSHSAG